MSMISKQNGMAKEINIERHEPVYHVTAICEAPKETELSLNEYQRFALSTAIYPNDRDIKYLALALGGEVGEAQDKVKKVIRDKGGRFERKNLDAIALELGDALFYMSLLAHAINYDLSEIAQMNIDKINGRMERGTLHGSGDTR